MSGDYGESDNDDSLPGESGSNGVGIPVVTGFRISSEGVTGNTVGSAIATLWSGSIYGALGTGTAKIGSLGSTSPFGDTASPSSPIEGGKLLPNNGTIGLMLGNGGLSQPISSKTIIGGIGFLSGTMARAAAPASTNSYFTLSPSAKWQLQPAKAIQPSDALPAELPASPEETPSGTGEDVPGGEKEDPPSEEEEYPEGYEEEAPSEGGKIPS